MADEKFGEVVDAGSIFDVKRGGKWVNVMGQIKAMEPGQAFKVSCDPNRKTEKASIAAAARSRGLSVKIRQVGDEIFIAKKEDKS